VSFYLRLNVFVLLLDHIDFRVESIHVVVKGIVLFFSLNESSYDFFSRGNTSLLNDLWECILNDVNISNIHVHEVFFLLVVCGPFLQLELKQLNWVWELANLNSLVSNCGHALSLGLVHFSIISLLELVLEILDLSLETVFLGFVLGFERKDLVVGLFRNSLALEGSCVKFLSLLVSDLEFMVVDSIDSVLVLLLLSHDVNFRSEPLVFSLQIIEFDQAFVKLVF